MATMVSKGLSSASVRTRAFPAIREHAIELLALSAVVLLAAGLRLANLTALGEANHYYAAAVRAMLQSWHNWFFVAAEPGGSVTLDKPPVGFWVQTVSAYFLGVNSLGLLLPEILAGILSVTLLFYLVRRTFGPAAGLLAGVALAITPVVVATDRNNTIDSLLILTLLLAAWAFIKATESAKFRHLLLGAALVGIGFNIKMLQAFLPLPAFFALYFLGAKERLWIKSAKVAAATALLLVVSLSWATIVDLTPPDQRPYIGSSGNNTVMNLIVGYNGTERLLGMGGRGFLTAFLNGLQGSGSAGARQTPDGAFQPRQGLAQPPQGPVGPFQPPPADGRGAGGGARGFPGTGQPGAMRLFTAPLAKETSWLLPFGLFAALLLVFRARPSWPIAPKHQAVVLWGGWLVIGIVFFSVAGFFHEYYLSMLAPALAALVGIGAVELWRLHDKHPWLAFPLLLVAAGGTLWLQVNTASAFVSVQWWLPIVLALLIVGAALAFPLLRSLLRYAAPDEFADQLNLVPQAGYAFIVAALLVTPGIWSGLSTLYSSENQSLPAAYNGRASGPPNMGRSRVDDQLLAFLQARTQDTKYLMAVPSSMQGADYVLATGRPVLYLGGFMGQDRVVSADDLAKLVADGELRYVYWDARGSGGFGGGGRGPQADISNWVTRNCTRIQGYDTATQNMGAPDGTGGAVPDNRDGFNQAPGGMQVSLYECGR